MLLETIRIHRKQLENLAWHQARLDGSLLELFGAPGTIDLQQQVKLPEWLHGGVYKCRVVYDTAIRDIQFVPYFPKQIQSLAIIRSNDISYPHKFVNRQQLNSLLKSSEADEIIIVKNGLVTDSSFSNLAFFDGIEWLTPATPLLPGTQRAKLISEGKLRTLDIAVDDLRDFQSFKLINAMLPLEESPALSIHQIRF